MTAATQVNTQLTATAESFIRRLFRFVAGPEAGFQFKVSPGGCSGFAAEFDLVAGPKADDFVWEYEGLRIFLDAASRKLLDGATVDFVETRSHTGFVIMTQGAVPASCSTSQLVSIGSMVRR
jgi:iron-sulfur cluster assembly accessory protein